MRESSNSLVTEPELYMSNEEILKEQKELILIIIKIVASCLLLLVICFQLEFFIFFIIRSITKNIIFENILLIIIHLLILRYIIQSFLYILQFPLLKPLCFYSIACTQLKDLLDISKEYVNLYDNLKNQKKTFDQNDIIEIDNIANVINAYTLFFKELKTHGKLSNNQSNLYDNLCSWNKNYDEYKKKNNIELNINNKDNDSEQNEKKNFIYYLRQMNNDSKEIIKILDNFICENYEILSLKKLYNIFFNNTFSFIHQFSIIFHNRFNNINYHFTTSDNKIIDYSIVTYAKLNENYKNKNIDINKNKDKNLIIFCNPNGMVYQLYTPEKFLFLLEGGCDILFWNYRGYGYSTGTPTFKNAKTDIVELFDHIYIKGLYKKYGAYGYSVGGGSATFLCNKRNLDVLICDRNYICISEIARNISTFGGILYYLANILNFKYDYNVSEFIHSKNKNICKIVLCDPDDDIIPNCGSLKCGISKSIIKTYCKENNLKQTENIIDLFLNIQNHSKQADQFIKSILYIMDILIKFNENPFKNLINKKPKKKETLDKSLLINSNDNMELNKSNYNKRLINTIIKFFKCFNFSSENLEKIKVISEKRLKVLHINNYFNNFFIWGSICKDKIKNVDGFLNPFDVKNNSFYLNNAIEHINKFLNDKFIKSMLSEGDYKIKYDNLIVIKNGLQILMNKNEEFLNSIKHNNIGSLIRLDCGHNGLYSEVDQKNLSDILKNIDFIS